MKRKAEQEDTTCSFFNRFVAIDFETATGARNSACQIGLVIVEDGKIVGRYEYLIQPPGNQYNGMTTRIHGLSSRHTRDALPFDRIWPELRPILNRYPIVCHNAGFDIDVLCSVCELYGIEDLAIQEVDCTYELTGLALIEAAQGFGIEVIAHHNALADAEICAGIYLKMSAGEKFDPTRITVRKGGRKDHDATVIEQAAQCGTSLFNGKICVVTGIFGCVNRDDLKTILKEKGAIMRSSISAKTELVIAGMDAGPSKMEKIRELTDNGKSIRIIRESELKEILGL